MLLAHDSHEGICLCHLSATAQDRYRELMRGGCPEQAETLRTQGCWA